MRNNLILWSVLLPGILSCNGTTTGSSGSNLHTTPATYDAVYANINLGVEYMRQKDYQKALERLERARMIDPNYSGTYNVLGMLYQQLGENAAAERSYKRALSLSPSDPNTLNNYGQFLCGLRNRTQAEAMFLRAAGNPLYDTPEVALYNAGSCAQIDGDEAGAETFFRRALEIKPEMQEALIRMAEITVADKNYLSARGYLQRYLGVAKHTAKSLWLGIQIERELGDTNKVSSYAVLLRNSFPDSREARLLEESGVR
jgi:type IV pilus assembly protein PilF